MFVIVEISPVVLFLVRIFGADRGGSASRGIHSRKMIKHDFFGSSMLMLP